MFIHTIGFIALKKGNYVAPPCTSFCVNTKLVKRSPHFASSKEARYLLNIITHTNKLASDVKFIPKKP